VIVFFVNIWFWSLWAYVGLTQFKYKIAIKLATILRKLVCKRINDIDLLPVDDDVIGVSAAGNSLQTSNITAKQLPN
jgi:hypothetical protein